MLFFEVFWGPLEVADHDVGGVNDFRFIPNGTTAQTAFRIGSETFPGMCTVNGQLISHALCLYSVVALLF